MKKVLLCLLFALFASAAQAQCAVSTVPTTANGCTFSDYIDAFQLNNINAVGVAGCSPGAYQAFTSPVWTLQIGGTYTFNVTMGPISQTFGIWLDLNNDGFFTAAEMLYQSLGSITSTTGSITIPYSASLGAGIAMRTRCVWSSQLGPNDACYNGYSYGETHDFKVDIVCPTGSANLNVAVSPGTFVCQGTPVTMTATGAQSFTWTGSVVNATPFTPSATQTYTVTGGMAACPSFSGSAVRTISVTNVPLAVSAVVSPSVTCAGQTATITASGASNYTFTPGSSAGGTVNTMVVNPSSPVTYSVKGYNGIGCPGTAVVNLVVNPLPVINTSASHFTLCEGETATITASGANNYSWTSTPPGSYPNAPTIVVTPTTATSFIVSGNNSFNCINGTSTVVLVSARPSVGVIASSMLVCSGGSVSLDATGASQYAWVGGPLSGNYLVTPNTTTQYTVVGTNNAGCASDAKFTVNVFNPPLSASASTVICSGQSINLTASGADSYEWIGAGFGAQINVQPTSTTIYTLSATTTSNGVTCPTQTMVMVTVNSNPIVGMSVDKSAICRYDEFTLTASGASTYTWILNNKQVGTGSSISVSHSLTSTNNYSVVGADQNGCIASLLKQVKVESCTGISEFGAHGVRVYPNPARDSFVIENPAGGSVTVVNNLGQVVLRVNTVAGAAESVDIKNLPEGVYFVVTSNGEKNMTRMIIAR